MQTKLKKMGAFSPHLLIISLEYFNGCRGHTYSDRFIAYFGAEKIKFCSKQKISQKNFLQIKINIIFIECSERSSDASIPMIFL